ncbi:MAG TPA: ThiF family adenylyltransferase [Solirubrobacteraceae bacterium]|nr:ThiF family adenylyltransferase [Solirubrobacteraceae bacterium]
MPEPLAARLRQLAALDVESGAVLLARAVRTPAGNIRLLARDLLEVPDDAYDRRDEYELLIRSEGYVPALALADETGCVPIWFHTHPGDEANPAPSEHDVVVNESLADVFRLRGESEFYGALIVAPTGDAITFTGSLDDGRQVIAIDRLWVVGSRLALYGGANADRPEIPALYDRNVKTFGGPVQEVLQDLRVAIVGCGGTGSAVAEQLVRLGVRKLDLIDPDMLSASNVTRVYGSTLEDIGRPKVEVMAEHLRRILPDVLVTPIHSTITVEETARQLLDADIVFGCTDDNAGRMVLSRFATYLTTPVIDCGVLISADAENHLDGIHGRVTVLHPGQACLICRGRVDLARARSELLSAEELQRLVGEGYAPALPGVEPAVVAYTSAVAAAAVAELIERLTGYGAQPVPSEILLRLHDREMSTNNQMPTERHYCDPAEGKVGLGETKPFLEQTW